MFDVFVGRKSTIDFLDQASPSPSPEDDDGGAGGAGGGGEHRGELDFLDTVIKGFGARPVDFMAEKIEDYVAAHTDGSGFDAIFDTVGGNNLTNSFAAAALNAHVVTTVALSEIDLTPAHFKGLSLHIVFMLLPMLHDVGREVHGQILADLAKLVDEGKVKPLLDEQTFTLSQVGAAYARLQSGQAMGKVVVEV